MTATPCRTCGHVSHYSRKGSKPCPVLKCNCKVYSGDNVSSKKGK